MLLDAFQYRSWRFDAHHRHDGDPIELPEHREVGIFAATPQLLNGCIDLARRLQSGEAGR
jgi:hypothetical protein